MSRGIEIKDWQKRAEISLLVKAAFPTYRRKTVVVIPAASVTFQQLAWDGGSRNEYQLVRLNGTKAPVETYSEGETLDLIEGIIAVQSGTFCGKPALCHLYVNPADINKLLPDQPPVSNKDPQPL
jgi:hypothetical protein